MSFSAAAKAAVEAAGLTGPVTGEHCFHEPTKGGPTDG